MIIVIAASVLVLKGKGMEAVRRFLPVLILLLGLMNCIAIPCFGFPDENNHFGIAYDKAMYAIGNNEPNNLPYAYVYQSGLARTDPSLSQIEQLYRNWTDFSYGNHRTVWLSREYNRNANFVTYEYVPQIAGIAAASLAKLPWYLILTAGRLASLLFCLLIIVLCLRLVPDLSFAAAGIMLLPSVIWMLASYSYDGWNLVMCILFLTLCIWLSGKNKINIWQILALGAAFLLFVPIKYIYIVYGLMIFIIPFTKNTDKRLRVALLIIGAAVISIGLISRGKEALELLTTSLTDDRGLEQGLYGEPYSIHWVISHPIDIMLSFSKTLFVYADAILTKMMIGEFNNQRVPLIIAIISFFCVMYLLKSKGISIPQGSRKWPYLTLLFGIFAIFGSFLFLYSYRVEGTYGLISGMQGRYFLPYLILFPLLFRPEHNRISNGKECGALLCIWMLCNANVWFIIYQFTGLS